MLSLRPTQGAPALLIAGLLAASTAASAQHPKYAEFGKIDGAEKVSINLLQAVTTAQKSGSSLSSLLSPGQKSTDGSIVVELVTADVDDTLLAQIGAVAPVTHSSAHFRRVNVSISDPSQISALATIEGVLMVRPCLGYTTNSAGSVSGYADLSLRSDIATSKYGVDGTGIRVGILSDSFANPNAPIDLTTDLTTTNSFETRISVPGDAAFIDGGFLGSDPRVGDYTLVVQTDLAAEVTLEWSSDVPFQRSTVTYPVEEQNCRNRITLEGGSGRFSAFTRALEGYPGGSCAQAADNFVLFGFRINSDITNLTLRARASNGAKVYMSLRGECADLSSEVVCGEPQSVNGVSGLRNQLSGDLPPTVTVVRDFTGSDATNEGAAMAELIHDIAPGADIGFHTAFGGQSVFAEGIRRLAYLKANDDDQPFGANIIVDDVIYFAEPMFQHGIIAQAVEEVVGRGVTYFSAAGNFANKGYYLRYQDVSGASDGSVDPKGNDLMRWPTGNGYLPITLEPGASFRAFIQWNQPWESLAPLGSQRAAQIDLDAYVTTSPNQQGLFDAFTSPVPGRSSRNAQGRTGFPEGDPIENVSYINDTGVRKTVYLAVNHYWGEKNNIPQIANTPLEVRVVFLTDPTGVTIGGIDPKNNNTGGPTQWGHSLAPGAISVGAVNWFDTPKFSTEYGPTNAIDPEYFSSTGGKLTVYFDGKGMPISQTTFEPDLAAVDGNNTTFFPGDPDLLLDNNDFDLDGFPNFFGTSAAAPNAAAVAALLKQMNPRLTPAQVETALKGTAIDVTGERASAGYDSVSGAGLVDALAAADYVALNYGLATGGSAPTSRLFTFSASNEGWVAEGGPGFTNPGFDVVPGYIALTDTNSINTLGWAKSPEFIASGLGVAGLTAINGTNGRDSLYRMTARVSTNATNGADVPVFRLRQSTSRFEQSDVMVVSSVGPASLPPSLGNRKTYRHFFSLPPTESRFTLYLDLLGFGSEGAAGTQVQLDEVIIEAFPSGTGSLAGNRLEKLSFFSTGRNNWNPVNSSGPGMGSIRTSSSNTTGLVVGPADNAAVTSFGFWSSPSIATFEQSRLYRAAFQVATNVSGASKTSIPTFRARVNDSSYQFAAYVDVNSTRPEANFPSLGTPVTYYLYFETPQAIIGNGMMFAFDYLYVPGGKDPSATLYLQSFRLDSYSAPIGP